ncbi:hypothetical protein NESM_000282500 [Novymonas esmeraldas]|uniref:Uncharacterized protein n=1 Tax=Novymonas esmeraldas TaxID=1808958 RepID=A0AAW0F7K7_9TRYP
MYYGGYDQNYAGGGGDQGYAGGYAGQNPQDFEYQQQQMMMQYQADGGYNPYGQQDAYAQQQMMMMNGAGGYAPMAGGQGGYADNEGYSNGYSEQEQVGGGGDGQLRSSKSFTGPPPGVERKQSTMSRARSIASRSSKAGGTGMARHGSVFVGNRERDTQVAISTRGGMSTRGLDEDEGEELKEYYGDMACRQEERRMDGLKAVRSYRGDIEDGEDVGKPRRVTNRRNVDGRSATGYGGIHFKRKAAMRNGEQWGDVEVRRNGGGGGGGDASRRSRRADMPDQSQSMMQQQQGPMYGSAMFMAPGVYEEGPVVPHIFNQEDVHSYSNLSDAFTDEGEAQGEADF